MDFDVLVVNPNPLLNLVHFGDFLPGTINRVKHLTMLAEGKGVNVARFLARHGHSVIVAGFAGGHSGAWLRELIRSDGIRDACIETEAPLRVGFMASGREADHPTTILPDGFPVTAAECQKLLDRVDALLGSVRLVIASGSVPSPMAEDLYVHLLQLCDRRSVECWLDAYGPAMTLALAGPVAPRLSAPNRQEFDQSVHWERVEELHITDGAASIEVNSLQEGRWRVLPPVIRQVNPVGSGDCYLAGLAHGRLSGLGWENRLRYAASAGAANAMRQAVAMVSPDDVAPLLDQVQLERISPQPA